MSLAELSSRAIIGRYHKRIKQNSGMEWVKAVSNYFTSDQESETYKWLGQVPSMREWVGGRQSKGFTTNGLTIENKHFEATLEIPVVDMRRDKTGQIYVQIDKLADETNTHWAQLLSKLIINGESAICYDGQYYFDTDHKEGKSGLQSNKIQVDLASLPGVKGEDAGSPFAPSEAALRLSILQTIQQILSYKDDQGEPMNENASKFLVMVPTSMWYLSKAALAVPLTIGGASNMVKVLGDIDISVTQNPRLDKWKDKFAVFRIDDAIRPFIRQEEKPVTLKAITAGSELEFKEDKHEYGVDTWRNVGYGFWQHACLSQLVKA